MGIPKTSRYSILEKYQIALTFCELDTYDPGREPFQSVAKPIKLRNALVHYEPTFEPISGKEDISNFKPHSLGGTLSGLFELNPFRPKEAPMWPDKLLSAGCAKWCSNAAIKFMESFYKVDKFNISVPINKDELFSMNSILLKTDWGKIFSNKENQADA